MDDKIADIDSSDLRSLIDRLGISQEKYAKSIGIDRKTISNYLSGKNIPDLTKKLIWYEINYREVETGPLKTHDKDIIKEEKEIYNIVSEKDLLINHLRGEVEFYRQLLINLTDENKQTGTDG